MTIDEAVLQLSRSDRGINAMRRLLAWLDDDGLGLDQRNQEAVLCLLRSVWQRPGSTRDAMREALEQPRDIALRSLAERIDRCQAHWSMKVR